MLKLLAKCTVINTLMKLLAKSKITNNKEINNLLKLLSIKCNLNGCKFK